MPSPRTLEHSPALRSTPEVATQPSTNKTFLKHNETRIQPWMAFANPNDEAHSKLMAEAKPLSVIGRKY